MDIRKWLAPDGFLSFYHQAHEEHGVTPFPDSCHHTGYWLMMEYILGTIDKVELKAILDKGMRSRWNEDLGRFMRYPGSEEDINRDQCMFLIPLLYEVGMDAIALHLLTWHLDYGLKLPHWKDFWYNEQTWWGRRFETMDAMADRIRPRETSVVKNLARLSWNEFKGGDRNDCAWKHIKKAQDPNRCLEIYFSRRPATQEEDYDNLPTTPGIQTPPPIYIPGKKVMKLYA
jgi:hypothetical protein